MNSQKSHFTDEKENLPDKNMLEALVDDLTENQEN